MTDRELFQMALEAMDVLLIDEKWYATKKAIRARLAEPDPLPPPTECQTEAEKNAYAFGWWKALETVRLEQPDLARVGEVGVWGEPVAIYRAGQAEGEVYHVQFFKEMNADEVLLYAHPPAQVIDKSAAKRIATQIGWAPKREWQGLTDEEKQSFLGGDAYGSTMHDINAIEAKLKAKNA